MVLYKDKLLENLNETRRILNGNYGFSMFDKGVLSLCSGEGNRRPHPSSIARGLSAILDIKKSALDNYKFMQKNEEFENSIIQRHDYKSKNNYSLLISEGVTRIFESFIFSSSEENDIILLASCCYHPLPNICNNLKRNIILVEGRFENNYLIDYYDLEKALIEIKNKFNNIKVRSLIIFNPSYFGTEFSEDMLHQIISFCEENNIILLEDSIFFETNFNLNKNSLRAIDLAEDRVDIINASGVSKAQNLSNVRIGWAYGSSKIIDKMKDFLTSTNPTIFWTSIEIALGALTANINYLNQCNTENKERMLLISNIINELNKKFGFEALSIVGKPIAGHSILIKVNDVFNKSGVKNEMFNFSKMLLNKYKTAVSPGDSHGVPNTNTFRICYSSVGSEYTYNESIEYEKKSLKLIYENIYINNFDMDSIFNEIENWLIPIPLKGWSSGRDLISDALNNGIYKYLNEIIHEK